MALCQCIALQGLSRAGIDRRLQLRAWKTVGAELGVLFIVLQSRGTLFRRQWFVEWQQSKEVVCRGAFIPGMTNLFQLAQDCPSFKTGSLAARDPLNPRQTTMVGHPDLASDDGVKSPQEMGFPE